MRASPHIILLAIAAPMAVGDSLASAQPPVPIPIPLASPTATALSSKGAQHSLTGTITHIKGTMLTIRLRNGRSEPVDVSEAIAAGTYSAPLFIGKFVVVRGTFDRNGILHADTVTRLTNLSNVRPDQ